MIVLDPELSLDGRTPVRRDPGPARNLLLKKKTSATLPTATERPFRLPSARTLAGFLRQAQEAVKLRGQVSVLLTTDQALRRLNRQFRRINKSTDVLSFPACETVAGEVAGDLAISVPTALRQAIEQGHGLGDEIKVLMLHGLLHLAGFDHVTDDGRMARRERLLRHRLGLPQGLIERAGLPAVRNNGKHTASRVQSPRPKPRRAGR